MNAMTTVTTININIISYFAINIIFPNNKFETFEVFISKILRITENRAMQKLLPIIRATFLFKFIYRKKRKIPAKNIEIIMLHKLIGNPKKLYGTKDKINA